MSGDSEDGPDFLDLIIASAEKELAAGIDADVDWEEMKHHPMFASEPEEVPSNHPVAEALAAIEDDPDDEALDEKKEGNFFFKCKKYRSAVKHYTEGIKKKSPNRETNAQLLSNRAAANFHLGNYGSSVRDCALACKLKPDYLKAIIKGVQSCMKLNRADEAITWSDRGLLVDPHNTTLLELRKESVSLKTTVERDNRKERSKERKLKEIEQRLISAIQERKIRIAGAEKKELTLNHLETQHPNGCRVFVGEDGTLNWPVVLVYPEFKQMDTIAAFNENSRFIEQLEVMFSDGNPPAPWDPERRYRPHNVELYCEDKEDVKLLRIKTSSTLGSVLSNRKYVVYAGTPSFLVLVKDSQFGRDYVESYSRR